MRKRVVCPLGKRGRRETCAFPLYVETRAVWYRGFTIRALKLSRNDYWAIRLVREGSWYVGPRPVNLPLLRHLGDGEYTHGWPLLGPAMVAAKRRVRIWIEDEKARERRLEEMRPQLDRQAAWDW